MVHRHNMFRNFRKHLIPFVKRIFRVLFAFSLSFFSKQLMFICFFWSHSLVRIAGLLSIARLVPIASPVLLASRRNNHLEFWNFSVSFSTFKRYFPMTYPTTFSTFPQLLNLMFVHGFGRQPFTTVLQLRKVTCFQAGGGTDSTFSLLQRPMVTDK